MLCKILQDLTCLDLYSEIYLSLFLKAFHCTKDKLIEKHLSNIFTLKDHQMFHYLISFATFSVLPIVTVAALTTTH